MRDYCVDFINLSSTFTLNFKVSLNHFKCERAEWTGRNECIMVRNFYYVLSIPCEKFQQRRCDTDKQINQFQKVLELIDTEVYTDFLESVIPSTT